MMCLAFWFCAIGAKNHLVAAPVTNHLEIRSISADNKAVPFSSNQEIRLPAYSKSVVFDFGLAGANGQQPLRLRYKLDGYDQDWQVGTGARMLLRFQFYNAASEQVGRGEFATQGQSPGWNGSLETSPLRHRREELVVPAGSDHLTVILSGRPSPTLGSWAVRDLVVSRVSNDGKIQPLARSPSDAEIRGSPGGDSPPGWSRSGQKRTLAKTVELVGASKAKVLAIVDDDSQTYVDWRTDKQNEQPVAPGDTIVAEWNEVFDLGDFALHLAEYPKLESGLYTFQLQALTALGNPTGIEYTVKIRVPVVFWHNPWFWVTTLTLLTALLVGVSRYFVWRHLREKLSQVKQEQVLEKERLRISQDLHDDLGARVTEISLFSAMAQADDSSPDKAHAGFERISLMSRELVAALYETVWSVNPENDNLDALGNFICQMVNRQCESAQLRCRFDMVGLPQNVRVSSKTRHQIVLSVKEAVHNAIKHAHASEINIRASYTDRLLSVLIEDNGRGFKVTNITAGHGLTNMKRRLESIGGNCTLQSEPTNGTMIQITLSFPARDGYTPAGESDKQKE